MSDKGKGILDEFVKGICTDIEMQGAIEASRDENGKIDITKATAISMGLGHTSDDDIAKMAGLLGVNGAFDDDFPEPVHNCYTDCPPVATNDKCTAVNEENPTEKSSDEEHDETQENEPYNLNKKMNKKPIIIICVICAVLVLAAVILSGHSKTVKTYNEAVKLTENGDFEEAKELFCSIDENYYHDTSSYINLCKAHIAYDRDDLSLADYYLTGIGFDFLSEEQSKEISAFIEKVKEEYKDYIHKKAEAGIEEYRKLKMYGMPEETTTAAHYSRRYSKPSYKYNDDPYDVNDYSNEEDFYYDHYDDFFDYYDAEDYYNDHHE